MIENIYKNNNDCKVNNIACWTLKPLAGANQIRRSLPSIWFGYRQELWVMSA